VNAKKTAPPAVAGDAARSSINVETRKLHQSLIAQVQALSARLGDTTDPAEAEALLGEIQQVNFRVMTAGSLLFKQTTAVIDARIADVVKASDDLQASLDQLKRINDLVRATTKFLGVVDKVLGAIKLL
jgi:hypothetical protein